MAKETKIAVGWEEYPYLFDLYLLHDYAPGDELTIFIHENHQSYKKRFKEWRGIVSSIHSHLKNGTVSAMVAGLNELIIVDIYEDKNSTVQCYPLDYLLNFPKSLGVDKRKA